MGTVNSGDTKMEVYVCYCWKCRVCNSMYLQPGYKRDEQVKGYVCPVCHDPGQTMRTLWRVRD